MTLIFIHGSGCTNVVWERQCSMFPNSVALNLPGHPDGKLFETVDEISDWLLEYLDKNSIKDAVLVGHSLGGAIALQSVISSNSVIKGLVLIGSGARLKVMPEIVSLLTQLAESKRKIPELLLSVNQNLSESHKNKINSAMQTNGARVMLADFNACNKFDVMSHLSEIKIPVQIIVGSNDEMTPVKYGQYLNDNIPLSIFDIIEGGTHMVFAENPEAVNQLIERFLLRL